MCNGASPPPPIRHLLRTVPDLLQDLDQMLFIFGRHASKHFGSMDDFFQQRRVERSHRFETGPVHGKAVVAVVHVDHLFHLFAVERFKKKHQMDAERNERVNKERKEKQWPFAGAGDDTSLLCH